jgi:hypothetical protein
VYLNTQRFEEALPLFTRAVTVLQHSANPNPQQL